MNYQSDFEDIQEEKKQSFLNKIFSLNRWSIFGLVAIAAIITVLYIYNVTRINNLLSEIRELEHNHEIIKNSNDLLKVQIIKLQSADRIIPIAQNRLGMIKSTVIPEIIVK